MGTLTPIKINLKCCRHFKTAMNEKIQSSKSNDWMVNKQRNVSFIEL